jgi:hypothetical protein
MKRLAPRAGALGNQFHHRMGALDIFVTNPDHTHLHADSI